jgi:hypothetical protein
MEKRPSGSNMAASRLSESSFQNDKGYVKTTSMAKFYYRKSPSAKALEDEEAIQKASSDSYLEASSSGNPIAPSHTRNKSKSQSDLSMV